VRYRKSVIANGVVEFDKDQATTILAPISGPVTRLLATLGQKVKKGTPLAAVASPDYATAVGAYQSAIATARAARHVADMDKDLLKHHGVSQREAEQAEADAVSAEASERAARQTLRSLNVSPRIIQAAATGHPIGPIEGMIRAPIAGTVVGKTISPGELLQAGSTRCFTIANLSRMWVMAQVFGSDLRRVHIGDPVTVMTGIKGGHFTGRVDNIAAVVDPNTRSVAVRVLVDNPDEFLKQLMYVRVRIEDKKPSTGLLVPVSAVLRDSNNLPFVYVEEPDGSFARRSVRLGYRFGDHYALSSGIHAGDQVVVNGSLFLQFMQNQ
jgi:cobalt-zinc-cadmium efflux system membrane fusion protein